MYKKGFGMKIIIKSIFYIMFILSVFATGCEYKVEDTNDYYNFEVISHDGIVSGYYKIDGGAAEEFSTSLVSGSTTMFSFQKNLTSPESIRIVTYSSIVISSVEIYVYQNSKEVDYTSDSITVDGDTVYASIYYEFTSTTTK